MRTPRFRARPFDPTDLPAAIAFVRAHPWKPEWPEDLVRRFLTALVSSTDLVLDLRRDAGADAEGRVALAVLLDRTENPANLASLETLGLAAAPDLAPAEALRTIIDWACERSPATGAGIQVTLPAELENLDELARSAGLRPDLETFEMTNPDPRPGGAFARAVARTVAIVPARPGDDEGDARLYALVRECFRENVDANLSPYEEWRASRAASSAPRTWLAVDSRDGRELGFLNLFVSVSGPAELRMVGVRPEARGRGIARALIDVAMAHLESAGVASCVLSVATRNGRALELYRRLGFEVTARFRVFRRAIPGT